MTRTRHNRVCILTRFPRLGEVKTRLTPPLSAEEALELHERLTRQTLRSARALVATRDAVVDVRTDAAFTQAAREWLRTPDVTCRYQGGGDLGARISRAFAEAFGRGAGAVLVVGSDCPRLSGPLMRDALQRLSAVDLVLGPAVDGGYYLIGLSRSNAKRAMPALVTGVPWGTGDVLARTVDLAEQAELTYALLELLPDVDRPEDLPDAEVALARTRVAADASVSVVIPALDDATLVASAVASAWAADAHEVLVVDGGSRDATREVAATAGARVIVSAPGRARQMNAGAAEATGDVLIFLHADSTLPPQACPLAVRALADPATAAGGFSFSVPESARHARLISAVGRARGHLGGSPWGDQALFLSRDTFAELGGFPEQPTMEDFELVRRLGRFGRVVTLRERTVTSARAWEEHGLLLPTLMNLAVIAGYRLGVDPEVLARWRKRIAPSRTPR